MNEIAGSRPLAEGSGLGFPASTLIAVEKEFNNVWTPTGAHGRVPTGGYTATFGDQYQVFGRQLGFVQALELYAHRSTSATRRSGCRTPPRARPWCSRTTTRSQRYTASSQLGANASMSYRLSPGSSLHLRGFYTNSADDEVRKYQGLDNDSDPFYLDATRLMYVQRDVLSGAVEGQHGIQRLLNSTFDWRFTRSVARRQQPDRRESTYQRVPIDPADPNSGYWGLVVGRREYGDLKDNNWGTALKTTVPFQLGALGNGKVAAGYDRESKYRDNYYRRFDFIPNYFGQTAPPESVYDKVNESTLPQDNYRASQLVEAFFLSSDLPMGRRVRGNVGVRYEEGRQDVVSHDLFNPARVTSEGKLVNSDWLGGANVTWAASEAINVRAAASRTLSRPDLDELSPRPTLDYIGDYQRLGNPNLKRALIENYDLRVEAFPSISEVLAASVFMKELHEPIENTVRGASSGFVLIPENSASGRNVGVEFELRTALGRFAPALKAFSINTNVSVISSHVKLKDMATKIGSQEHPLQGQANHLVNAALNYQSGGAGFHASVLMSIVGSRLTALSNAAQGIPDHYNPGTTSLDVTMGVVPFKGSHLTFGASNLLDQEVREVIGTFVSRSYRTGRSFTVAFSYGS